MLPKTLHAFAKLSEVWVTEDPARPGRLVRPPPFQCTEPVKLDGICLCGTTGMLTTLLMNCN